MNSRLNTSTIAIPSIGFRPKTRAVVKKQSPELPTVGSQVEWSKRAAAKQEIVARGIGQDKIVKISILLLGLVSLGLFVAYLVGVNTFAGSGYEIKKLQKEINEQKEKEKMLNMKIAETNSLISVQSAIDEKKFVPIENPTFIGNKQLTSR